MTQLIEHNDDEIKQYHRKRLFELSEKSVGEIPHLEDPNDEQKQWVERRMRGSEKSWEVYDHV